MVNRLVIDGVVKFDLTDSTVTPENLLQGVVAYNRNGERVVGTATGGGSPFDDYLREPVQTDIDHSINKITSRMSEGTVVTTFAKNGDSKVITSLITPVDGSASHTRTTTITKRNQVTEVRETLT